MENGGLRTRRRVRSSSERDRSPPDGSGDCRLPEDNQTQIRNQENEAIKDGKCFDAAILGAAGLLIWSLFEILVKNTDYNDQHQGPLAEAFMLTLIYGSMYFAAKCLVHAGIIDIPETTQILPAYSGTNDSFDEAPKHFTEAYAQTDAVEYRKRLNVLQKRHRADVIKFRRRMHKLRRQFAEKINKLRKSTESQGDKLSRLQLKIPHLEKEKSLLLGEAEAISKQLEEERRRNKDLFERFGRLNQQLVKNGGNATGAYPKNNRKDRFGCKNRNFPGSGNDY